MNMVAKLTQKQIEKLAVEIRTFLLEHVMWVDTQIYFNGKCFDTHDKETGEFYYNDPEHLVVRENEDPRRYFENVAEDHILSMAFEGSVCHMLWYGTNPGIKKKFDKIFEKRGLYYEFGDSYWEDGDGWCYGNYLSDKMIKAGISFDVYYADSEE